MKKQCFNLFCVLTVFVVCFSTLAVNLGLDWGWGGGRVCSILQQNGLTVKWTDNAI